MKRGYLDYLYLDISIFPSRSLPQDLQSKFTISPNLNLSSATASASTQGLPGNLCALFSSLSPQPTTRSYLIQRLLRSSPILPMSFHHHSIFLVYTNTLSTHHQNSLNWSATRLFFTCTLHTTAKTIQLVKIVDHFILPGKPSL